MSLRSRVLLALLALLAAVAGAVRAFPRLRRTLPAPGGAVAALRERRRLRSQPQWQCVCGQRFRVSGAERHRVYWLPDADEGDPVMTGRCPNCDRELPGQSAA